MVLFPSSVLLLKSRVLFAVSRRPSVLQGYIGQMFQYGFATTALVFYLQITHFMHCCPCYLCELYLQALLAFLSQEYNYVGFSLALLIKALFFTSFGLFVVPYFDMPDALVWVNILPG